MLRLASVAVGVLGIGVALCFLLVDNALDAWWALSSVCSGGVLGMFLLAYLCPKAKKQHVVPGVVVGVASLILIALQTKLTDWMGLPQFDAYQSQHCNQHIAHIFYRLYTCAVHE